MYSWDGSVWGKVGSDINGEAAGDNSGWSVSLSHNGNVLAIGARKNDGNGSDSGHVRMYGWDGSVWGQLGADINGEAAGDWAGYSVSLSSDGGKIAIGARYNSGNVSRSGHVRVYSWDGSVWGQVGSDIDGQANDDQSGLSVSLSADGSTVAIGGPYWDSSNTGNVRIFS